MVIPQKMIQAAGLIFFLTGISVAPALADVTVRTVFETSSTPLTTEMIWDLDPSELNPHRQNWVLSRSIELLGLRASAPPRRKLEKQIFKVGVDEVFVKSTLYLRAPGGWYRPFSEFGCRKEPNAWFSTQEGAREAGNAANEYWDSLVNAKRLKLSQIFSRVSGTTEAQVLSAAKRLFSGWLIELESEWRAHGKKVAREAEWHFYLDQLESLSSTTSSCGEGHVSLPDFKEMMEPVPALPPDRLKPFFVRVPARRWNGLYVIHATLDVAGKKLNGQFLLDSGSAHSLVSPSFLSAQGVPPSLLELNGLAFNGLENGMRPEKVMWSGGNGWAKPISGFDVSVGGKVIGLKSMMMLETALFAPPAYLQACCSGVLGVDFLRKYAVEFVPGPPVEIKLWNRAGFYHEAERPWVQVASTVTGDVVSSDCIALSSLSQKDAIKVVGTRWDTGSDRAMEIHTSLQTKAGKWSLLCREQQREIAGDVPVSIQDKTGTRFSHHQIANAGMALLGRGDFTLDLSHGRLWFAPEGLSAPVLANHSGLTLEFVLNANDDRELRVAHIVAGSVFEKQLKSVGFQPGTIVSEIDGRHAIDMDLWEVEQRLSGAYADTVTLLWRQKSGKNETVSTLSSLRVKLP